MGRKILIIGGSYFAGRVFSILASREGCELTFLNRGKYSMKSLGENIREFKADRRDEESLKACGLSGDYDAVVDFCAYEPQDIRKVLNNLSIRCKKYIYLSTADVYKRAPGFKNEDAERMSERPFDEVGLYAYNKKLVEDELVAAAEESGFSYTILRPAFIYGPYNYAPRESLYIRSMVRREPVYQPSDAKGQFCMVYVKDVGQAILNCIEKEEADNKAYNLSAPGVLDYDSFLKVMEKAAGHPADTVIPVTVSDVIEQRLPLPFPLTEEESELFDGSRITEELGFSYTPIEEGMEKTYTAFRPVYER